MRKGPVNFHLYPDFSIHPLCLVVFSLSELNLLFGMPTGYAVRFVSVLPAAS
jgi:hypothetical protein